MLLYLYILYIVFMNQLLPAANTDLFNPIVSKAHKSECQNLIFPLQMKKKQVKASLQIFIFLHPWH